MASSADTAPDPAEAILAQAMWDTDNTNRLSECPEETEEMLRKARNLRHWLNVLGYDVTPVAAR
jgi:hypothetical protein